MLPFERAGAPDTQLDKWADWVFRRRFGGNEVYYQATMQQLGEVADRIIARAEIQSGQTVLDIGTGDGIVGVRCLERVGAEGTVIFSDISASVIENCRELLASTTIAKTDFVV